MRGDRPRVHVRRMQMDDIEAVLELDRLAFPLPWSSRTYRHEILNNDRSTMLVVENAAAPPEPSSQKDTLSAPGWLHWLMDGSPASSQRAARPLVAYAGFWQIADEAHISTIAVHPDWRGKKIGELLIWIMVREAFERDAAMVTLEVRVSNEVALNLYRKYGFEITGRRKGYYRDNSEDAYTMAVKPLDDAYRERLRALGQQLAGRLHISADPLASPG